MTKKRITEVYNFIANASMKKMSDDEKIMLIRLLRQMKGVAKELTDAVNDAVAKAREEGMEQQQMVEFVNKAVDDLAQEETTIQTAILTPDAFDRLALSNDWTFAQIEELGEVLIKTEEKCHTLTE